MPFRPFGKAHDVRPFGRAHDLQQAQGPEHVEGQLAATGVGTGRLHDYGRHDNG